MDFKIDSKKNESTKKNAFVFLFILSIVLLLMDQGTKYFAGQSGEAFRNYLFAFSLPVPFTLMYLFYLGALVILFWHITKNFQKFTWPVLLSWWLILSGACINVGERLVLGYVRDFIYIFGGVLNFADFYIIFGIIYLFVHEIYSKRKVV